MAMVDQEMISKFCKLHQSEWLLLQFLTALGITPLPYFTLSGPAWLGRGSGDYSLYTVSLSKVFKWLLNANDLLMAVIYSM